MEGIQKESPPWKVLLFPYGSEIANEVQRALSHNKYFHLVMATSDDAILASSSEPEIEQLPFVTDERFESELRKLVASKSFSFVIPAHDDVALALADIGLPGGCKVIGQSRAANEVARYKKATYQHLRHLVPVPKTYPGPDQVEYPVFVKPDRGQGSKETRLIRDQQDLHAFLKGRDVEAFIFSEFLPGAEYTVDCFSDRGSVLFAGPRTRERTINGISSLSRTLDAGATRDELVEMADRISQCLEMHGLWFFQAKADSKGTLRLLEVATRVSGTMMVNRAKGVNFVELALWQALGHQVEVHPRAGNVLVRRTLEPHYEFDDRFDRLLVDFDDTLLVDSQLNVDLMALIFKAKNLGKPIVLITKNQNRMLSVSLHKYGIGAVFDDIIHIEQMDHKTRYLRSGDLLVDDSHAERIEALRVGVKSISLDMVEMYIGK